MSPDRAALPRLVPLLTALTLCLWVVAPLLPQDNAGTANPADRAPDAGTSEAPEDEPQPIELSVPLVVNDRAPVSVEARVGQDQTLRALDRTAVAGALANLLESEAHRRLAAPEEPWVTPEALRELGLDVDFNRAELAVFIRVPVQLTAIRAVPVLTPSSRPDLERANPATVSASLIIRSRFDHAFIDSASGGSRNVSVGGVLSPAVAVSTFTAEGEIGIDSADEPAISLDAVRLIGDLRGPGMRATLGDLQYPVRGLQAYRPMFGFSIHREDALVADEKLNPRGGATIEISEPTEARFVVNGRTIRSERLDPGRYELTDFPLLPGVNDVRIELVDRTGGMRVIEDVLPFSPELLAAGAYDYAGAIGFPRWSPEETTVSGYYYRGLSSSLTAGVYTQVSAARQLLGLGRVLATRFGNFGLDLAWSRNPAGDFASAILGEYRVALLSTSWAPRLGLVAQYQTPDFGGPGAAGVFDPEWSVTASLSQQLPFGGGANIAVRRRTFWGNQPSTTGFSLNVSRSLGNRGTLIGTVTATVVGGETSWGGRILFSSSDSRPITTVNVVQNVRNAQASVRASQTRSTPIGELTVAGSAGGLPPSGEAPQSLSGTARLDNHRMQASMNQRLTWDGGEGAGSSRLDRTNTSIQFGTGLYYADGAFAVARPGRGGFAMARIPPSVPIDRIELGSGSEQTRARTGVLGPAVVTGLTPYTPRTIEARIVGLPIDYSLGQTTFSVESGYRRGTVLPIDAEQLLYARGTLVTPAGEPIALEPVALLDPAAAPEGVGDASAPDGAPAPGGGAASDGQPEAEASAGAAFELPVVQRGFTDEDGVFELYDLQPGQYIIAVGEGARRSGAVTIRAGAGGVISLGEITVERGGAQREP